MDDNFAIQLFEGKRVRIVWDAEQEKYYFSIVDIVQVLTDSADAKQYIKKMRARDPELDSKWGTICTPVEMRAFDGKRRKMMAVGLKDRKNFIEYSINPAMEQGIVRMVYPDSPRHPRQKYMLTVTGMMLFNQLSKT